MDTAPSAAWRRTLIECFPETTVRVHDDDGPWTYRTTPLGAVSLHHVEAGAQHVSHPAHARFGGVLSLLVQLEGRCRVAIDGEPVELEARQWMLADAGRRCELEAEGRYRQAFLLIPLDRLGAVPRGSLGRPTDAGNAVDRLLFDQVVGLEHAAPSFDARQTRLAVEALLAHLRLSTRMTGEAPEPGAMRVERALAFIEAHLADADLTADDVARAQTVGRRYLDALFERRGTTIAQALWERRLVRAAALLHDPSWDAVTVLGVGVECGFRSAAHFSRTFRARFGATPSAYRARRAEAARGLADARHLDG